MNTSTCKYVTIVHEYQPGEYCKAISCEWYNCGEFSDACAACTEYRYYNWLKNANYRLLIVTEHRLFAYLRNRFYLRGTTKLGILNTLLGCLFNVVIVRQVDSAGETIRFYYDKGTNHSPEDCIE